MHETRLSLSCCQIPPNTTVQSKHIARVKRDQQLKHGIFRSTRGFGAVSVFQRIWKRN